MKDSNAAIGSPISRIDGIAKVTGKAAYSTDHPVPNLAYAIIVKSTIAAGSIREMDTADAEKAPGVLAVITHENAPKLTLKGGLRGIGFLQTPDILYFGQHIGIVVAETFEQARLAMRLIRVTYNQKKSNLNFEQLADQARLPKDEARADARRGDAKAALSQATIKVEAEYTTPIEHHHPLEPHATIAEWTGDTLTLYNSAQMVNDTQAKTAVMLNLKPEQVRIVSPYVGGGFGSKGSQWANVVLGLWRPGSLTAPSNSR